MKALARTAAIAMTGLVAITGVGAEWSVEHVAGGGPDGIPAVEASLAWPRATAVDDEGNVYIVVTETGQVLRVDPSGIVHTFMQSGIVDTVHWQVVGASVDMAIAPDGDFVVANEEGFVYVRDASTGETERHRLQINPIAVEAAADGSIYLLYYEDWKGRVLRFDPAQGTTSIVAGRDCGNPWCVGQSGEGVPAAEVDLTWPADIAMDSSGNLHIAEYGRVRRVNAADGTIWTVAGTGETGFSGDGGPALEAQVLGTGGLAFDHLGNLYFGDAGNERVRRVDKSGVISTIAGNGAEGFSGDGGAALDAALESPRGTSVDASGNVYVVSQFRVRRIDAATGIIHTFSGNGTPWFSGDGSQATAASFSAVDHFTTDEAGNLLISDYLNNRVRRVDVETGIVTTFAGTGEGTLGVEDDGVPASQAVLAGPTRLFFDPDGNLYVSVEPRRMRRIAAETGLVSTVRWTQGVFDPYGDLYEPVYLGIGRVDPATGEIEQVAGNGSEDYNGEGVPALEAGMGPWVIDFDAEGNLFYVDVANWRIRRIWRDTGLVETVIGGESTEIQDPFFGIEGAGFGPVPALGGFRWLGTLAVQPNGDLWVDHLHARVLVRVDGTSGLMTSILGRFDRWAPPETDLEQLIPRNLTVGQDGQVYFRSGMQIYRVHPGAPPVALAGSDMSSPCESRSGAKVTLDASLSFDPDDDPDGLSSLAYFWWYEDLGLPGERVIAKGRVARFEAPIGDHDLTLLVRDASGQESTDSVVVSVVDEEDPDDDGFASCVDTCPEVADPGQQDTDGNGRGDLCDPCAHEPFGDGDGDGICSNEDNCPEHTNPGQGDADGDGVGDVCDDCPDMPNPGQAENGTCIGVSPPVGECRNVTTDASGAGRRGRIQLAEVDRPVPIGVELAIEYNTCNAGEELELFLNGVSLGRLEVEPTSQCGSSTQVSERAYLTMDDAEDLASIWRTGKPNELRLAIIGSLIHFRLIRVDLLFDGRQDHVCFLGFGDECESLDFAPNFAGDQIQIVHLLEKSRLAEVSYGPEPPSRTIDLPVSQYAEYELCVSASRPDGPHSLLGSTESGDLLEINPFDATSVRVGSVPLVAPDIDFDPENSTALAIGGLLPFAQRFDIRDGTELGRMLPTDSTYHAVEYVGDELMALDHDIRYSSYPSLRILDVDHPGSSATGMQLSPGFPRGLAHDEVSGELWGIFSKNDDHFANSLRRFDLETSRETTTAISGLTLDALQFGPDALLYSVSRSTDYEATAKLYYIDTKTPEPTFVLVGDTGITGLSSLTLPGRQGTIDCVVFPVEGEQRLAINASCGPPTAVVGMIDEVECDTAAGGTVTLDGSGSSDPNSSPGTNDGLAAFDWYENYGTAAEAYLGSGPRLTTTLGLGAHEVTLRVTNRFEEAATSSTTVVVVDFVPPGLSVGLSPVTLWPPNHRMVQIVAEVVATDACGDPAVRLVGVTSSEADDHPGGGDGHTVDDIQSAMIGEADFVFDLRAERAGSGAGRVYEVVYEAVDAGGHRVEASTLVAVPHSLGGVSEPVKLLLQETPDGTVSNWNDIDGALHYNVIRGSLAALRPAESAMEVGPVHCIEARSLDATTAGHEDGDPLQAGEAFFYLVEYFDGWGSSYGSESVGVPRVVRDGDCQ